MSLISVNDLTFMGELGNHGLTLVDFGAPWCSPCKTLLPILEELAQDYAGEITILKVNVEDWQETASLYTIMSMPTVIFFVNGEPVDKLVGLRTKDVYCQKIEELRNR